MTTGSKNITFGGKERRQHKRYPIQEDALVFIGKETGTIIDMSEGGLAVRFVSMKHEVAPPKQLDLFLAESQFYLPNLPILLVNEMTTPPYSLFSSLFNKRLCLQFGPLTNEQQSQVKQFLRKHSTLSH
jgi:hypothetical protein